MAKYIKWSIGIIGAVLAVLLVLYSSAFLWFIHVSRWKYNVKDFPDYQQDFTRVADFCSEFIRKEKQADPDAYDWFWYSRDRLSYSTDESTSDLELSPDLQESIETIWQAFPSKDAKLDHIRCLEDGSVYFITHNGLYALVYCPNGTPVSVYGKDDSEPCVYRKIVDHWYHVCPVLE